MKFEINVSQSYIISCWLLLVVGTHNTDKMSEHYQNLVAHYIHSIYIKLETYTCELDGI